MIHGAPVQILERRPELRALFELDSASESPRIADGEPYRPGEVIARFPLEMTDDDVQRVALQVGASKVVRKGPFGLFVLYGPENRWDTETIMRRLWETGKPVMISPNYTRGGLTWAPNDPHFASGAQWALESDPQVDIDLDMEQAWEITRGSPNVVVAVMDTGIFKNHPEFAGRLWQNPNDPIDGQDNDGNDYVDDINGWDSTSLNGDNNVEDDDIQGVPGQGLGHGTYVSAILLANSNNDHQVAGIDHHAKVMVVRALNQALDVTMDHILGGLEYLTALPMALPNPAPYYDLVNMSWITSGSGAQDIVTYLNILESRGAIVVAGSGNSGVSANTRVPAGHSVAITVGATDADDVRPSWSNHGSLSLDFVAPGVGIYTAAFPPDEDPYDPLDFHVEDGTSFSSPMVAGAAALGFAVRPAMTRDDLMYALKQSAVDLGTPGWDQYHGWGRINVYEAVRRLAGFFDGFETGDVSKWSSSAP